ncbi:GNAT family N-acetyltransferase [Candidatus Peregrinibacteria bacterium]|nr:GNAT family N-acetyltransferase [Candidatus Peregrinibacteria bacterium]
MNLQFSTFRVEDFPEYKSWYDDAELNKRLGPMDDEWLSHIMSERDGCEYSIFRDRELVAVTGLTFPTIEHPYYIVTDLAIKPHLRDQGIGSAILHELMRLHALQPGQSWKVFVDIKNPKAKLFFEKNGWICESETPDKHGMLTLTFVGKSK